MSEKEYKIKCENLFKKNTVLLNQQKIDAEQIRALQKQNGELADELTLTNNECKNMREELKQRIRENQKLCEQIEKMKCCYNCANDTLEPPEVIGNGICEHCKNHDKWELAD